MKPKAFSLIEILVTIAIIAIVGALGLNAFTRIKDDVRYRTVVAKVKELNIAKQQYITDTGRLAAESNWNTNYNNLSGAGVPGLGRPNNADERCYDLLKRYIERPQAAFADVVPDGNCSIATPPGVHGLYTGSVTYESDPSGASPHNYNGRE